MAFSWEQQIYPTGSQNVTVSIAYLDKSFIYVYLDGVLTTNYTWASDAVLRLDDALTASTEVLLVRRTNKEYLFIQFAAGAPFISDNLDTQNTQFLHLAQEMVEGRSIEGFYGDISMNGYKITNLGRGTEPGDAVNLGQLNEVDTRVTQLEQTWIVPSSSYPWFTNTMVETDVLTPGFIFTKAALYINGVCQTPGYSYEVVDNTIMLADPVPAGTHVMARLGEDISDEQGYATTAQLSATNARVTSLGTDSTRLSNLNIGRAIAYRTTALDWNTFTFINGSRVLVNQSVMSNVPSTLSSLLPSSNNIDCFIEVVGATAGTFELRLSTATTSNTSFVALSIRGVISGAVRTYYVRQEWDSSKVIPLTSGGTGAATAVAARTGLGLGTLATQDAGAAVADATDTATALTQLNALLASLRAAGIITT